MISLSQIDAAVTQVRYYNPDLELELLFLEELELEPENAIKVANIRSALVARVADIVRQASSQPKALDAAVSSVELLISSYSSHGDRSGQGHKHALQAIRLLASVSKRFDAAIDLFFDLVERFCAQNHIQGQIQGYTLDFAHRMTQNYDQTLVKLISRQWSKERRPSWDVDRPIARIKTLRRIYGCPDENMSIRSMRGFSIRKRQLPTSILFSESLEVLRSIRNRSAEMALAIWAKSLATQIRGWSRKERAFDYTASSVSTSPTTSNFDPVSPLSKPSRRKRPTDSEVDDLQQQVDMLCAVIEKSAQAKVYNPKISDVGTGSTYTFNDAMSLRSQKTGLKTRFRSKLFHAI